MHHVCHWHWLVVRTFQKMTTKVFLPIRHCMYNCTCLPESIQMKNWNETKVTEAQLSWEHLLQFRMSYSATGSSQLRICGTFFAPSKVRSSEGFVHIVTATHLGFQGTVFKALKGHTRKMGDFETRRFWL